MRSPGAKDKAQQDFARAPELGASWFSTLFACSGRSWRRSQGYLPFETVEDPLAGGSTDGGAKRPGHNTHRPSGCKASRAFVLGRAHAVAGTCAPCLLVPLAPQAAGS